MPRRESCSSSSLPRTLWRAANLQPAGRRTTGSPLFTHRFCWGAKKIRRPLLVAPLRSLAVDVRDALGHLRQELRRVRSLRGCWRPQYTPKLTQRRALLGKLKERFRRYDSQPVGRVITGINPILRGWVNYFRIGSSGPCFAYVLNWVEKKVRRHLMRARNRAGFGWARWSTVGLDDYHVRYGART
jgi:Group II intron, maturase-specific domain